jgi:putative flippase GtrA
LPYGTQGQIFLGPGHWSAAGLIDILYPKLRPMASQGSNNSGGGIGSTRDIGIALLCGVITGALAIPIAINLALPKIVPWMLLPIIFAALFAMALIIARIVAARIPSLFEFTKFSLVGMLNSGVDFGILNSLILVTGMASGWAFVGFKSISVTLGVINSYVWNKFWTFDASKSADSRREFAAFLVVTVAAVAVNVLGADVIVNVIGVPRGVSPKLWANFGAISGAGLTLFTNFFGYKFFVFRKPVAVTLAS